MEETNMTYTLEMHDSLPAIVARWGRSFRYRVMIRALEKDLSTMLDQQPGPISVMVDMGHPLLTVSDVFDWARMARCDEKSFLKHPQLQNVIWITQNPMLEQAYCTLTAVPYIQTPSRLFPTYHEAERFLKASV